MELTRIKHNFKDDNENILSDMCEDIHTTFFLGLCVF